MFLFTPFRHIGEYGQGDFVEFINTELHALELD